MPAPSPSVSSLPSNISAANFLSSFTAGLDNGGALAGLFENLLAAAQTVSMQPDNSSTSQTQNAVSSNGSGSSSSSVQATGFTALGDIISGLQNFAAKWQNYQNNDSNPGNNPSSGNAQQQNTTPNNSTPGTSGTNSSTVSSPGNPLTAPNGSPQTVNTQANADTQSGTANNSSTTGGTASTGSSTTPVTNAANDSSTAGMTGNTSSGNSSSDPNAVPSPANLLAELQMIFQLLQQQIQAAQTAAPQGTAANGTQVSSDTTATGAAGSNAQTLQDLLAAGGALADLLALAQVIESNLGSASPTGPSLQGTNLSAVDPNLAGLDTQLRANLKSLIDQLQAAVSSPGSDPSTTTVTTADAGSASANSANIGSTDPTLATTPVTSPVTPDTTSNTSSTSNASARDIITGALATANDFLKQINNLYSATPSANAAPQTGSLIANAVLSSNGSGGTSLDANANDTASGGNATNLTDPASAIDNTQGTNIPVADNPKTTGLYTFASQLSAMRAQNGGTIGLPSAVEQVLLFLNRNANNGGGQMSIQLHPADLGSINVKLDFANNGTVTGTVTASNPDTLALLQKDSRSLERALQDAGLRADPGSLQFNLGGQPDGNAGQTSQGQQPSGNAGPNLAASDPNAPTASTDTTVTDGWIITPGRVDIQV